MATKTSQQKKLMVYTGRNSWYEIWIKQGKKYQSVFPTHSFGTYSKEGQQFFNNLYTSQNICK